MPKNKKLLQQQLPKSNYKVDEKRSESVVEKYQETVVKAKIKQNEEDFVTPSKKQNPIKILDNFLLSHTEPDIPYEEK